jgi:hypothetical protein
MQMLTLHAARTSSHSKQLTLGRHCCYVFWLCFALLRCCTYVKVVLQAAFLGGCFNEPHLGRVGPELSYNNA